MIPKPNEFSILIPFHSRIDLLLPLLDSLKNFSVLVVNDGGVDIKNIPNNVRVIENKRASFARSVNKGLELLAKEGVSNALILNDDCTISSKDLELLQRNIDQKTLLSPVIHCREKYFYGARIQSWGRIQLLEEASIPDALLGTCLMIPTTLRFDEGYPHGFEDLELSIRAKKNGYTLKIIEEALCFHVGEATLSSKARKGQRYSTYGHLRLFSSKRKAPIIVVLSLAQIARERGSIERYLGWSEGVFDWISTDFRSFAARMASSKLGSNKAK